MDERSPDYRYRRWAGEPNGTAQDPERCVESVSDGGRGVLSHQCYRKRGHGPWSLYCKQHGKLALPGDPVVDV